ncbi:TetR/AcrR family transcriptional regulator [soil metagenome]
MVTRAAKSEERSEKREAILDAALELFVEKGFYGTAVPEIADRAKVGAGTIYRYFDSKEALVNAIYRLQKTAFGAAVVNSMPAGVSMRELFRTMWTRMADFASKNLNAFVFMELHHHAQYLDQESRALEERMLAMFTSVLVDAQARGDIKAGPPHLIMGIVMGAFTGVIRSCVDEGKPPIKSDWELAEQILWEAVRT